MVEAVLCAFFILFASAPGFAKLAIPLNLKPVQGFRQCRSLGGCRALRAQSTLNPKPYALNFLNPRELLGRLPLFRPGDTDRGAAGDLAPTFIPM